MHYSQVKVPEFLGRNKMFITDSIILIEFINFVFCIYLSAFLSTDAKGKTVFFLLERQYYNNIGKAKYNTPYYKL